MDQDWLKSLNRKGCVIVPTRSLQSELNAQIAKLHIAEGETVWESANVLTWPDYLELHWRRNRSRLQTRDTLLKPFQSQLLWESVIEQSRRKDDALTLLNVQQTARAAKRSWQLAHDWQLDLTETNAPGLEDTQQFLLWTKRYQQLLEKRGLLDSVTLYQVLIQLQLDDKLETPFESVIWYGFDLITTAQRKWQQSFAPDSDSHSSRALPSTTQSRVYFRYPDNRSEIKAVLTSAREFVEANPGQRVSIVVPNLAQQRAAVESLAAEIFYDGETPGTLLSNDLVYRFSLGRPLAQWPAIQAALQCLRLLSGKVKVNDLCWLLRNPFLSSVDEETREARDFIHWLKTSGLHRFELIDLPSLLEDSSLDNMSELAQKTKQISEFLANLTVQLDNQQTEHGRRALHLSEWRQIFVSWLDIWGWSCGEANESLSSVQFQLLEKWRQLIKEFEALVVVQPRLGLNRALDRLTGMSRDTIFLPKAAAAPVFIAGLFESIGSQSELCFITGLDDSFPPTARPDPFVGDLLRQHPDFPGATPLRQMQQAQQVITSVMSSASHCVLSYAVSNEQNPDVKCGVSPLLRNQSFEPQPAFAQHRVHIDFDHFDDPVGQPLPNPDSMKAGISSLTDQANCAFRAYARHRLRCEYEEDIEFGLDPLERGSLIHLLLEMAWTELQSSSSLSTLIQNNELAAFTERIATETVNNAKAEMSEEKSGLVSLEVNRLSMLLQDWLLLEAKRPTGFSVVEIEEAGQHMIGNLAFRYKLDRVDLLDDGRSVVIDYKTGTTARSDLTGERLRQPQLAIYVDALTKQKNTPPSGAAFAQVRPFECQFAEVAETEIFRPETHHARKHMEDWQQAQSEWPTQLAQLAHEFETGDARVNPIDEKTCQYCDLHSLCRINQTQNAPDMEGSDRE